MYDTLYPYITFFLQELYYFCWVSRALLYYLYNIRFMYVCTCIIYRATYVCNNKQFYDSR